MFEYYVLLFIVAFLLNVQPIFNMPSWIVLSFFAVTYNLPIMTITVIGVATASLGRYVLARYTGELTDRYLPKKQKENVRFIAEFIVNKTNPIEIFTISFLYGLSPLPTNTLFMVAGAAHMKLPFIIAGFFFGEFLSNFVYVSAVSIALNISHLLIMGVVGIALTGVIMFVDWKKLIHILIERERRIERKA